MCLIRIVTATTLIHLCSFDCTKIATRPCAGHYVCKWQRKRRLWSWCWTAASWLHDGIEGRQSSRWRDGSQKGSVTGPRLPESSPISCQPGGFGHPVLTPRRGPGVLTPADTLRSQPAAMRGGRTCTGGSTQWLKVLHTVTERSSSSRSRKAAHWASTPSPYTPLVLPPPKGIWSLFQLFGWMSRYQMTHDFSSKC